MVTDDLLARFALGESEWFKNQCSAGTNWRHTSHFLQDVVLSCPVNSTDSTFDEHPCQKKWN